MRKTCLYLLLTVATLAELSLIAPGARAAAGDIFETNMTVILRMVPGGTTPITFATGMASPKGLVFDGAGKLYVADASRGAILRFSAEGGGGATFAANLESPVAVTFDANGGLWVGEAGNGKVSKFDVTSGVKTNFASGLGQIAGLVFSNSGILYASDFESGKIFQIMPDGTKTTFASGLNFPSGLAFDTAGNLYEADSGSGTIFKFAPDGTKTSFANGLSRPYGVAFEATGNLVVSDNGNGSTFRFTPAGERSTVFSSDFNIPQFLTVEPEQHQLLNISTRGTVGTGDQVLIAGFNVGGIGPVGTTVIIRALGPSLSTSGVANPLADPLLGVIDGNGAAIAFNDNWIDAPLDQRVGNTTLAPPNPLEPAVKLTLRGGAYTAVVTSAIAGGTGTALVEVYNVQ